MPAANHSRIFEALYSVMNEIGQVVGYWMTHGSSIEEVKPELRSIANRYEDGRGPEVFYTDRCCQERQSLTDCMPSLGVEDNEDFQRVLLDVFHLMDR